MRLGYQVMEGMRNHLQHRGFPLEVSCQGRWYSTTDGDKCMFSMATTIVISELEKDKKFSKPLLKKLKAFSEMPDAVYLCADYVGAMASVHCAVIEKLSVLSQNWSKIFDEVIADFKKASNSENVLGLAALSTENLRDVLVHVNRRPIDYLIALQARYTSFGKFEDRFVSSRSFTPVVE